MEDLKQVIESMPEEAWSQVVKTVCETFNKLIFPLTATTEGVGRLIKNKFQKFSIEQQIIAAKCIQDAANKARLNDKNKNNVVKPAVIYEAFDNTDQQTDETIRSLWSNLLAHEFSEGSVHPEIAKLLAKITTQDAILLVKIAEENQISFSSILLKSLASKFLLRNERETFNHIYLEKIGLIEKFEGVWILTIVGREFMKCVSDPK